MHFAKAHPYMQTSVNSNNREIIKNINSVYAQKDLHSRTERDET
jgi:hypothetical protein